MSTGLYRDPAGRQSLDLATVLRQCQASRYETWVYMGRQHRLPVRLLCQRLPEAEIARRRRKARQRERQRGKPYSQTDAELLAWSIHVTTVPETLLKFDQVMALYRLRWQIELRFKLWKSQARLDHMANWRPHRVLCHLYAHLIGLIIFHWTAAPYPIIQDRELSLPKAFSFFRHFVCRFLDALLHAWHTLPDVLRRLADAFSRYALKDSRRQGPSSLKRFQLAPA